MPFKLVSPYVPTGDQPEAIKQLVKGVQSGDRYQTLLGVTGSGKTFTMANVIAQVNRPTLILSHNKTLAAQLFGEFRQFFPENAVEYFISYYDYYQPEAYIPNSGLYIEKDLSINQEIEKLRLRATSALISGRRDVIVVASVSCIYGMGNPEEFSRNVLRYHAGQRVPLSQMLFSLVQILYSRTQVHLGRGQFRVKGDTVDVYPPYAEWGYRFVFFGDEIEAIQRIDVDTGKKLANEEAISLFPANLFVTGRDTMNHALNMIQDEMMAHVKAFETDGKFVEAKRVLERTEHDMEMMRELGYCSGIENYSRYFDGRRPGQRPFCLLDYFPDDYLMFVDESHVTMPQIRAMYGGDRSRKVNLVEYGFRLPSAMDNRPLTFNEFEAMVQQTVFVSATPSDYELAHSDGVVVEQLIRPTGLVDPEIEVRPCTNQVDDLLDEADYTIKQGGRVLVTTLTKRMAEELARYMAGLNIKCRYIHSEIKALERVEILRGLRLGEFDVLIGVNLLREGLDLPEVSLVAIMDADKEGFLRNVTSLVQTIGRAARNEKGKVVMYADNITRSMRQAIDETSRRREKQIAYNEAHGIIPKGLQKTREQILEQTLVADARREAAENVYYTEPEKPSLAADPVVMYMSEKELEKAINKTKKEMEAAAKDLDFITAARLRDEWQEMQKLLDERKRVSAAP